MDKVTFRFNTGCQDYLYDCYILPDGFKPIKLFEDTFFGDVICTLSFLVDPQRPDFIGDIELAEHLLQIAKNTNYSFSIPVWDVGNFLCYNKLLLKQDKALGICQ